MSKKRITVSIMVLFLSAIAATSGTFAWFITTREATVQYTGAKIYSSAGDLIVDFKSSLNTIDATNVTHEETVNILSINSNQKVTDISGDGIDLHKVVWSSVDNVSTIINDIETDDVGDADSYFVDFTITISRLAGTDGFKAFLGDNTHILPFDNSKASDTGILDAVRMVVINYDNNDSDDGDPSVVIRHGTNAEVDPKYLVRESGGTAYGSGTHNLIDDTLYESKPFVTETSISLAEQNYAPIADLMTETSVDVTFRFFIEGTDTDAKDEFLSGTFKVNLDIYTLLA